MAQTVKVHILDMDWTEIKEVSLEEAQRLVTESYANGRTVVDKGTGNVIDEITPGVDEIIIVGIMDGG